MFEQFSYVTSATLPARSCAAMIDVMLGDKSFKGGVLMWPIVMTRSNSLPPEHLNK
jgi:hypothetical protein